MRLPPFHLAVKVSDLAAARDFYTGLLDCPEGRSSDTWVDFNFFGHQLVCHLAPSRETRDDGGTHRNPVVMRYRFRILASCWRWTDGMNSQGNSMKMACVLSSNRIHDSRGYLANRPRCFCWTQAGMCWNSRRSEILIPSFLRHDAPEAGSMG